MDPLHHAVDRHHQWPTGRDVQYGGVVAQAKGLDSVFQHAADTL